MTKKVTLEDLNSMSSTDLLLPAEVAGLFRVDPKTVTRWANRPQDNRLESIRTPGGHRRYPVGAVRAFRIGNGK